MRGGEMRVGERQMLWSKLISVVIKGREKQRMQKGKAGGKRKEGKRRTQKSIKYKKLRSSIGLFPPLTIHAAAAKSLQSCLTLCDPIDSSPPGSPVPGILQARTLEWVAISFSSARKWKVKGKSLSHVRLFATPWTAAYQAPPSMGFSRQEYWSGVPLPSPYNPWGSP